MPVRLPIFEERKKPVEPELPPKRAVVLSAEQLFRRYFAPAYPEGADLDALRQTDVNPAKNPAIYASLDDIAQTFARLAPQAFARDDLELDGSDASVHRLAAAITPELRDAWLVPKTKGAPPTITLVATHGALYVGACIVRNHGGLWQARNPLWESMVELSSRAGTASLAVFQWWMKALGDEEIDAPRLADRYRSHVELPTRTPESMPVIASADRRLPRLSRVRYDVLYKHLKAHLPELRDVGADFPSPERFEELGLRFLDFTWLGAGRMLLIHGAGEHGVHLFWMDRGGFVQGAFYPADRAPEHRVETEGDVLRVRVSIGGRMQVHETLWWGA
jgi:hypothetical protein